MNICGGTIRPIGGAETFLGAAAALTRLAAGVGGTGRAVGRRDATFFTATGGLAGAFFAAAGTAAPFAAAGTADRLATAGTGGRFAGARAGFCAPTAAAPGFTGRAAFVFAFAAGFAGLIFFVETAAAVAPALCFAGWANAFAVFPAAAGGAAGFALVPALAINVALRLLVLTALST